MKQQKPKLVLPTVIFFFEIQEPSRYKSNGHLPPSPSFSHTAPLSLKKNLSAHLKHKQSEIKSLSSISGLKVSFSDLISLSNTLNCVLNSWNRFCFLVFLPSKNPSCFLPYPLKWILSWYWCSSYSRIVQVIRFAACIYNPV